MAKVLKMQFTFQSTLPVGGATKGFIQLNAEKRISIHAPRGGSDLTKIYGNYVKPSFQSTLPAGGATN